MSLYLVAGQGELTDAASIGAHLPTSRPRRYPSDTADAEWLLIAPHIPTGEAAGRPLVYPRRDIVDAIRYLDHNGCVWRALPVDFPPWRTVYHYFRAWTRDGTLSRLHDSLRVQARQAAHRQHSPSAAIIDSQSVRGAETVARTQRGYDAAKKINGRKRHLAVDTSGLLLVVLVTAASVQDRDAARLLLTALRTCFTTVTLVWADAAYAGRLVAWAATSLKLGIDIVRKLAGQTTFQPLPRRWVVERTIAWINRSRRTVRDYERHSQHHAAMVQWAMVTVMTRRLARATRACATT
jgi:putative transposase